ncbi:MAG: hypothetical protein K8R36_23550 [Planctomycetales bacterium]|nr:hypothetical protein [Planctomycetales bacterium]
MAHSLESMCPTSLAQDEYNAQDFIHLSYRLLVVADVRIVPKKETGKGGEEE